MRASTSVLLASAVVGALAHAGHDHSDAEPILADAPEVVAKPKLDRPDFKVSHSRAADWRSLNQRCTGGQCEGRLRRAVSA
jgi:hypothetical protein